jgi:hypothetical protein
VAPTAPATAPRTRRGKWRRKAEISVFETMAKMEIPRIREIRRTPLWEAESLSMDWNWMGRMYNMGKYQPARKKIKIRCATKAFFSRDDLV